jgi:hypothetical protein
MCNTIDLTLITPPGKERMTHQMIYDLKNGSVKYDHLSDTIVFRGPLGM